VISNRMTEISALTAMSKRESMLRTSASVLMNCPAATSAKAIVDSASHLVARWLDRGTTRHSGRVGDVTERTTPRQKA
jgi:hypothetical protein